MDWRQRLELESEDCSGESIPQVLSEDIRTSRRRKGRNKSLQAGATAQGSMNDVPALFELSTFDYSEMVESKRICLDSYIRKDIKLKKIEYIVINLITCSILNLYSHVDYNRLFC